MLLKPLLSKILVAVSGSVASVNAAKYAILAAKQYKCNLSAVYVVDTATIAQLSLSKIFIQEESTDYQKNLEENGKRYLAYISELAESKGVRLSTELRHGAVPTEVIAAADARAADLIILGGWENGKNSRDIISRGHIDIMHNAKASVLIVKEQNIDLMFRQAWTADGTVSRL
jgi:nucleotide-binding universal stress UspA family protein